MFDKISSFGKILIFDKIWFLTKFRFFHFGLRFFPIGYFHQPEFGRKFWWPWISKLRLMMQNFELLNEILIISNYRIQGIFSLNPAVFVKFEHFKFWPGSSLESLSVGLVERSNKERSKNQKYFRLKFQQNMKVADILVKNRNFGLKSIFWPKLNVFFKSNFGQNWMFLSKIETFV